MIGKPWCFPIICFSVQSKRNHLKLRCLMAGALETGKPPGLTGCLNRIFTPPVKYGKEWSIHLSKMRVYGLNQTLQTCARRCFFFVTVPIKIKALILTSPPENQRNS